MTPNGGKRVPKPRGRPPKLTPESAKAVLTALAECSVLDTAAAFAGVHRDSLHAWLKRGAREKKGPYREFSDAVSKALATSEVGAEAAVRKGMARNWMAAAWYLERRNPRVWGQKVRITLEQEFERAIERLERALPPEWFEVALRALIGGDGAEALGRAPGAAGDGDSPGAEGGEDAPGEAEA